MAFQVSQSLSLSTKCFPFLRGSVEYRIRFGHRHFPVVKGLTRAKFLVGGQSIDHFVQEFFVTSFLSRHEFLRLSASTLSIGGKHMPSSSRLNHSMAGMNLILCSETDLLAVNESFRSSLLSMGPRKRLACGHISNRFGKTSRTRRLVRTVLRLALQSLLVLSFARERSLMIITNHASDPILFFRLKR